MTNFTIVRAVTIVMCASLFASACSTDFHTTSVDAEAAAGTRVDGVPFRLSQPHIIKLYQKTQYGYVALYENVTNLPNQERVYVLRLESGLLSDAEINVEFKEDGTLSLVETKAVKNKGDEALSELAKTVKTIETSISARQAAVRAAEAAEKEAFEGELSSQAKALRFKLDADLLQAQFEALGDDTDEGTRQEKRKELLLAKFNANVAYQKLGRPSPFPEVTFP